MLFSKKIKKYPTVYVSNAQWYICLVYLGCLAPGLGSKIVRLDESEATGRQGVPVGFLHGLKPMGETNGKMVGKHMGHHGIPHGILMFCQKGLGKL